MTNDHAPGVGEEQGVKEEPRKRRPLVPIQHVGPIQFDEVTARYRIQIIGLPDTAHSQMAGIIWQLEEALETALASSERFRRSLELLTDPPPAADAASS